MGSADWYLQGTFNLGIYTSASSRTVAEVRKLLEAAAGEGPPLFPLECLVLSRYHTMEASQEHKESGGKDWDTVKPLARYFSKLDRLLLIDDDVYKVKHVSEFCA